MRHTFRVLVAEREGFNALRRANCGKVSYPLSKRAFKVSMPSGGLIAADFYSDHGFTVYVSMPSGGLIAACNGSQKAVSNHVSMPSGGLIAATNGL